MKEKNNSGISDIPVTVSHEMQIKDLERIFAEGLSTNEELGVVRTLIESIRKKSVLLYAQGIYDIKADKMGKVEVLARLNDGERILSPFMFLSFVKRFGLGTEFDMLILEKSLEHISNSTVSDLSYSINMHKSTLNDERCHETVENLMSYYKISSGKVIFEILEEDSISGCPNAEDSFTESSEGFPRCSSSGYQNPSCSCIDTHYNLLVSSIERYKSERGIEFSVDDFPMGTNCIHNLHRMKGIDYVKIDGVWLLGMLENFKKIFPNGEEMLLRTFREILFGIKQVHPHVTFVVERMENAYLFNLFKRIPDIQYFQGYHFSRPKPICEMENEIVTQNAKRIFLP